MSNKLIYIVASFFLALCALFLLLPFGGFVDYDNDMSSASAISVNSISLESELFDSATEITEAVNSHDFAEAPFYGPLTEKIKAIIEGETYKLKKTSHKVIGGFSIPVTTVTYVTDKFTNILVYEGHGICSEVFIDDNGVYFINSSDNTAVLMPLGTYTPELLEIEDLTYQCSGTSTVGTSAYTFERYMNAQGIVIDFLYSGEDLRKMKVYTSDTDYELHSLEISSDISGCRSTVAEDINISDIRN